MSERLEDLLQQAAPTPAREVHASEVWRQGRRRRRGRRAGLAAAAVLLAVTGVAGLLSVLPQDAREVEFAAPPPRIAAVDRVAPGEGLVADREVEGVRVRALVEAGQVCVEAAGPDPEVSARSCEPVETLPGLLALRGAKSVRSSFPGFDVFAALVPDGYMSAEADDGRGWEIVDNLLVIVIDRAESDQALPDWVDLEGPEGRRPLAVTATAPVPEGLLLDHQGQAPLLAADLTDPVSPAVVLRDWQRVFIIDHGDGRLEAVLADAGRLEDEGLWWCPNERVFVSPFHGELFDPAGRLVDGPARADLAAAPVDVLDGLLLTVDLNEVIPGQRRDGDGIGLDADIAPDVYESYERWLDSEGDAGFCADHQPPIQRPGATLSPSPTTP